MFWRNRRYGCPSRYQILDCSVANMTVEMQQRENVGDGPAGTCEATVLDQGDPNPAVFGACCA
jgi:hypothetical protein